MHALGCRSILGVDDPTIEARFDDAPAQPDAAIDAPPDARVCPVAPQGCTSFACAGAASCYYHCTTPARVWGDAHAVHEPADGCLVTIDDADESACLAARVTPGTPRWIGYQQPNTSNEPGGGWEWKCRASSYAAQWSNGEPNNSSLDEDCGELYSTSRWNDQACTTARAFFCEVP